MFFFNPSLYSSRVHTRSSTTDSRHKHASTRIRPPPTAYPVLSTVHVQASAHRPTKHLPWTSLVAKLVCRFLESGNGMSYHGSFVGCGTDHLPHARVVSSEALVLIYFDAGTWPDTSWTGCWSVVRSAYMARRYFCVWLWFSMVQYGSLVVVEFVVRCLTGIEVTLISHQINLL